MHSLESRQKVSLERVGNEGEDDGGSDVKEGKGESDGEEGKCEGGVNEGEGESDVDEGEVEVLST